MPSRSAVTTYLLAYNTLSLLLWVTILSRTLILFFLIPPIHIHDAVSTFLLYTQTFAVLEIAHSCFHFIRSSLPTTILQVFSRLFLVWGVVEPFYDVTAPTAWFVSMVLAWSASEAVRYGYFALALNGGLPIFAGERRLGKKAEEWVGWARYNGFWVLYPVGITSECVLVWKASCAAEEAWVRWAFRLVLGAYVPGSYVLYTHMIRQRRKAMQGKGKGQAEEDR